MKFVKYKTEMYDFINTNDYEVIFQLIVSVGSSSSIMKTRGKCNNI